MTARKDFMGLVYSGYHDNNLDYIRVIRDNIPADKAMMLIGHDWIGERGLYLFGGKKTGLIVYICRVFWGRFGIRERIENGKT